MVKTPCYYYRGHRFDPWSGKILHAAQLSEKRKENWQALPIRVQFIQRVSGWHSASYRGHSAGREHHASWRLPCSAWGPVPAARGARSLQAPGAPHLCQLHPYPCWASLYHPSCLLLPAPGSLPFLASTCPFWPPPPPLALFLIPRRSPSAHLKADVTMGQRLRLGWSRGLSRQ